MPAITQTTSATRGSVNSLLAAVTTGTSPAVSVPLTLSNSRIVVTGAGTISGGTLILEEAQSDTYAGTWSQLASVTLSTLSGGAAQVYHILGSLGFVRARLSANVTGGGTVSVDFVGA